MRRVLQLVVQRELRSCGGKRMTWRGMLKEDARNAGQTFMKQTIHPPSRENVTADL